MLFIRFFSKPSCEHIKMTYEGRLLFKCSRQAQCVCESINLIRPCIVSWKELINNDNLLVVLLENFLARVYLIRALNDPK